MKFSCMGINGNDGFSFVEVIVVLVILVIVSALIVTGASRTSADLTTQTEVLKNQLRHAQALAMGGMDSNDIFGIKCDTNFYWLFKGTDPDSNIAGLFDDRGYDTNNNNKLSLSAKKIAIATAFTVFFDNRGIPYSMYSDETSNTPFANDLMITIKPVGAASPTQSITITQHTGFIP
jgi:prepilin-type N-terminal cleavage/methylation domain-containing protein